MNRGGMGNIMRQAQQVQESLRVAQEEIARTEVTGESGGGLMKVTLNGKHEALRVEVSPEALKEDAELVGDLIAAAINDAAQKIEAVSRDKMAKATGGMKLPPGLSF